MNQRKSTILVVDDNKDIRDLITLILEDEGFGVIGADGGKVALATLREKHPDLVLLDIMMPEMSGYQVLREIRADKESVINKTPVVMLTAKSQVADIDEAIEAGATSYIVKPFIADSLVEKVASFLPKDRA